MNLASRVFMFAYAAAMAVVAAGSYAQHNSDSLSPITAAIAFSYLILAVGYAASRDPERAPAPIWLVFVFISLLFVPVWLLFDLLSQSPLPSGELRVAIIYTPVVLAYLGLAVLLLRDFRAKEERYRLRRVLAPFTLVAGAALVFSSLHLAMTVNHRTGWNVLLRKADWITSHINVGTPLFTGNEITWLQPIYAPGGYIAYLLALLATVAILLWLAAGRMSIDRSRDSSLLTLPAVIICLASFWVTTDIFWGWHFDLSATPWAAAVATVLWLAGPLFSAVVLVPLLWKRRETWRLRAFLLLQAPIAAFNFMQLQAYFGSDSLHFEGLGTLIIGLQLESWACLDLLAQHTKKDFPIVASSADTSQGDTRPPRPGHEAPKRRSA